MSKISYYIIFLFLVLFTSGCNDAPTEVGTEFLLDTLSAYNLTESDGIITGVSSYKYTDPLARNMGLYLVGQTANYTAGSLLRFSVPINKKITESQMVSCKLYLVLDKYAVGNTNSNQLSFDIKEVTTAWSLDESINKITAEDVLRGNLYGRDIASYSGTITRKDTMDTLVIDFNKKVCEEWLMKINDGENITDTVWGIGLLPNASSNIINGFTGSASTTYNSYIEIIADTGNAESLDTFRMVASENISFVESTDIVDPQKITMQSGVRVHSRFDIDLSVLSDFAAVNAAEMILYVDETASDFGSKLNNDSSLCLAVITKDSTEQTSNFITRILGQYDSTNKRVIFQIFGYDAMNYILRKSDKKGSLILMNVSPINEHSYLDKWVFYGMSAADVNRRPRLKLQTTQ